jgi:hypothetical protein
MMPENRQLLTFKPLSKFRLSAAVCAGVAEPGQRRRLQEPIPQGFVGSNPTPRTRIRVCFKLILS